MLSGDDMICYLLFPEVSFHCIDKWRKQDHAGVQMILTVWTQSFQFLNHFPVLSMSFFAFCSCWVCVWNSDWWWQKLWWWLVWTHASLRPRAFYPVSAQRPRRRPAQVAFLRRLLSDTWSVPTGALLGVAAARVCTIVPCICCTKSF